MSHLGQELARLIKGSMDRRLDVYDRSPLTLQDLSYHIDDKLRHGNNYSNKQHHEKGIGVVKKELERICSDDDLLLSFPVGMGREHSVASHLVGFYRRGYDASQDAENGYPELPDIYRLLLDFKDVVDVQQEHTLVVDEELDRGYKLSGNFGPMHIAASPSEAGISVHADDELKYIWDREAEMDPGSWWTSRVTAEDAVKVFDFLDRLRIRTRELRPVATRMQEEARQKQIETTAAKVKDALRNM